jgi:hypothetical protein
MIVFNSRQQLAAIIYPISMDNILPNRHASNNPDISRNNSTRRLNTATQVSTQGQLEMGQMADLSYDNRMSDHTFGKAQSDARQWQHERRTSWYEGGQTPAKATSSDFDDWKGVSGSEKSWKEVSRFPLQFSRVCGAI